MKNVFKVVAVILTVAIVFTGGYLIAALNGGLNITVIGSKTQSNITNDVTKDAQDVDVPVDVDVTDDSGETVVDETVAPGETPAATPSNGSPSNATPAASSDTFSKAEIIKIYNNAANKIKAESAGYTKKHVQTIKDETVTAVYGNVIGSAVLSGFKDKGTTYKVSKGATDTINNDKKKAYPACGYTWASKLTANDVKNATIKKNGNNYEIYITIIDESNPTVGDTSHFGRCMSPTEAAAALADVEVVAKGLNLSITRMDYYNGYIKATIDSKTGRMISSELSATCDTYGTGKGKDLYVKGVTSTETFTNFVW